MEKEIPPFRINLKGDTFGEFDWKTNPRVRETFEALSRQTGLNAENAFASEIGSIVGAMLNCISVSIMAGRNGIEGLDNLRGHVQASFEETKMLIQRPQKPADVIAWIQARTQSKKQ